MEYPNPAFSSPEIGLFLDILNQRIPRQIEGINSEKIIEFARFHDLSVLIFFRLQNDDQGLRQKFSSLLRPAYLANIHRNLNLWNEFLKINTAFIENKIAMLPLKGMDVLARFYPAFDLRCMCDIDILIREDQLAEAEKVLSALGYRKEHLGLKEEYWREKHFHFAFHKDHVVVEVHWGLDFKRGNRDILPGIWDRVRQVEPGNHKIKILSSEDAVFVFALHLRHFGNILALKQVLDSARIIEETAGFDWGYIVMESKRSRLQAALNFLLTQVSLFTKTTIPEDVLKSMTVAFWQKRLVTRFLLKHTFLTGGSVKTNYLKAHFLLYDSVWEAVLYLINIPHEQFCKYYNFTPYSARSVLLYNLRLVYMPLRHILGRSVERSPYLPRK